MANSTIKFYLTDIDPARNMLIEDIEQYLASCTSTAETNIMYIKPGLEAKINIAWSQSLGWTPNNTTYARVTTDQKVYYYFVTDTEWRAADTVGITLQLDTVNTFWSIYYNRFTDRTHITRQHKDRFLSNGARLVDKFDEGINPILQTTDSGKVDGNSPLWYLIYRSNSSDTNSTVDCYACASMAYKISSGQTAPIARWYRDNFTAGYYYYIIPEDDIADPEIGTEYGSSGYVHIAASSSKPIIKWYLDGNGYIHIQRYSRDGVADTGYPYSSALSYMDFIKCRRVYYGTVNTVQLSDILALPTMVAQAGNIGDLYINTIKQVDRTDPLLIKVVELGYAPFIVVTNSQGIFNIPDGWTYDANRGLLKLDNINTELVNALTSYSLADIEYVVNLNVNVNAVPNPLYESKLYNSAFYSLKFGYDSESWVFKPEQLFHMSNATYTSYPNLAITYKPSNGINSSCAFKFTHMLGNNLDGYQGIQDYDGYVVASRNNELPLYNNEYLNYLKYGKQYADRETARNIGATWLNTLLSAGGGFLGGMLSTGGNVIGGVVGATIGAIAGGANAINSTVKAIDAQQQKEWELQNQTTNISGNSDVDLFKWYSDAKLWYFVRNPSSAMKDLLFDLFFRGGYACNDYAIPNFNSRYWFNFIQCTPSFARMNIYEPYLENIKKRFEAGVTIFHHHGNEWNLNYTKENWETSLVGVFDINQLIVNYSTNALAQLIFTPTWNGPALSASQHIKFSAYATENDWINRIPTSTQNVTSGVAFTYTSATPYMVTFQIVDDNDVNKNSAIQAINKSDLTRTYYRSSTISNLYISDAGMIGCRTQGQSIRAADYLEFEYYRNNNGFAPTPDVTARIYGPYGSSTHTPATAIPPGDYNSYTGSILRCRIVCTSNPTDTSSWNTVTIGG